jgi:hypothetical protein
VNWEDLDREIWYWAEREQTATLWWRDDDAVRPCPELDRVLDLSARYEVPVALAVIPGSATPDLAGHLAPHGWASVLLHGFTHANHAGIGEDWEEYGSRRGRGERLAELAEGRARLTAYARFVPVLVPPWNRFPDDLAGDLPFIGIHGLSAWGPRARAFAGVRRSNVHVDVMDWGSGRFAGSERVLGQLAGHLSDRREGRADAGEPTGVMTHHAFHDPECWAFLEELFGRLRTRPGLRWLAAGEVFG